MDTMLSPAVHSQENRFPMHNQNLAEVTRRPTSKYRSEILLPTSVPPLTVQLVLNLVDFCGYGESF